MQHDTFGRHCSSRRQTLSARMRLPFSSRSDRFRFANYLSAV
jgi:hypothetical protein